MVFPYHFSQIWKGRAPWGKCPKEVAEMEGAGDIWKLSRKGIWGDAAMWTEARLEARA